MSCHLVRHFHVLTFHALQIGPSISCAPFPCPLFSAPPLVYELGATWPWTTLNQAPNVFKLRPARTNMTSAQCYSLIRDVCSVFKNTGQSEVCSIADINIQGHSRSSVTKCLDINIWLQTHRSILHRFRDTAACWSKIANLSHPITYLCSQPHQG